MPHFRPPAVHVSVEWTKAKVLVNDQCLFRHLFYYVLTCLCAFFAENLFMCRKRKKRATRYPADDDASAPEPEVAAPQLEVVVTPNRHMITMPLSLQGSPNPVTRR